MLLVEIVGSVLGGGLGSSVLVVHWECRWLVVRITGIDLKNVVLKLKTGNCPVLKYSCHLGLQHSELCFFR